MAFALSSTTRNFFFATRFLPIASKGRFAKMPAGLTTVLGHPCRGNYATFATNGSILPKVNIGELIHAKKYRLFSTHEENGSPVCTLRFYTYDVQEERVKEEKMESFSESSAHKVCEAVCSHLKLEEQEDRALVDSMFSDIDLNLFEFVNNSNKNYGVHVTGDRALICGGAIQSPTEIVHSAQKVRIHIQSIFGENNYVLNYDDICKRSNDASLINFWNSRNIKKFTQCSTNLGFARILEKIE